MGGICRSGPAIRLPGDEGDFLTVFPCLSLLLRVEGERAEALRLSRQYLPYLEAICNSHAYGAASLCALLHTSIDKLTGKIYKHILPKPSAKANKQIAKLGRLRQ